MDDDVASIADKRLHADARKRIKDHTAWFRDRLTAQAKLLAEVDGHDPVIAKDVDDALEILRGPRQNSRIFDFIANLGSLVLGIGITSFVAELARTNGPRPEHTAAFVILAFLGFATMLITTVIKR